MWFGSPQTNVFTTATHKNPNQWHYTHTPIPILSWWEQQPIHIPRSSERLTLSSELGTIFLKGKCRNNHRSTIGFMRLKWNCFKRAMPTKIIIHRYIYHVIYFGLWHFDAVCHLFLVPSRGAVTGPSVGKYWLQLKVFPDECSEYYYIFAVFVFVELCLSCRNMKHTPRWPQKRRIVFDGFVLCGVCCTLISIPIFQSCLAWCIGICRLFHTSN